MEMLHITNSIRLTCSYIHIIFIRFPFLAVYNIYVATLQSIGSSQTPFLSIVVSSFVNAGLDFFIVILQAGVKGATIATALLQIIMTISIILYIAKTFSFCKNNFKSKFFVLGY